MTIQGIIGTDKLVRVSFGTTEALDFSRLPPWIDVLDETCSYKQLDKEKPVFKASDVLPSGMTALIVSRKDLSLMGVTIRKKIEADNSSRIVLGFIFGTAPEFDLELSTEGFRILEELLNCAWGKMKVYRSQSRSQSTMLNISLSRQIVNENIRFSLKPCDWGTRNIIAQ